MAGATAAFPSAIYMMEMFDPTRPKRGLGSALRLSTFLGLCGGFLFAYQRTSFRFWGWKENEVEQKAHQAAIDAGVKPPGTDPSKSDLTPYMQGVAHRNSAFSQLKFSKCLASVPPYPTACQVVGVWYRKNMSLSARHKAAQHWEYLTDHSFVYSFVTRSLQARFLGSTSWTTHTTATTTRRSRPRCAWFRYSSICVLDLLACNEKEKSRTNTYSVAGRAILLCPSVCLSLRVESAQLEL